MTEILLLFLLLFSVVGLARQALILVGLYKDPVLHISERYAQQDDLYYALPWLLLWVGIFMVSGGLVLVFAANVRFPFYLIGVLLMAAAYGVYSRPQWAMRYSQVLLSYPRWYADLRERSTREERRRIAYMWLVLPRGVRLYYNSHDPAFNQWADLIILSTTSYTVEDAETRKRFRELM